MCYYLNGQPLVDLDTLQQVLGISFFRLSLLEQALVHSSYINENPKFSLISNERLEFLGDAILGEVIAEKLYRDFPFFDEGKMSIIRAALVRRDTLACVAGSIKLGDYLYIGKGEAASGGRHKPVNLAGALEAVIAAVFLDRGREATKDLILKVFHGEFQKINGRNEIIDYKSQLQELTQIQKQMPSYDTVSVTGPAHDRRFIVEVKIGNDILGTGVGKNKKTAEMQAARSAIKKLRVYFTQ